MVSVARRIWSSLAQLFPRVIRIDYDDDDNDDDDEDDEDDEEDDDDNYDDDDDDDDHVLTSAYFPQIEPAATTQYGAICRGGGE